MIMTAYRQGTQVLEPGEAKAFSRERFRQAFMAVMDTPPAPGVAFVTHVSEVLRRLFVDDETAFHSAAYRILALLRLVSDARYESWMVADDGGSRRIHPALVDAAATVPLTRAGGFQEKKFEKVLERIQAEEYADREDVSGPQS